MTLMPAFDRVTLDTARLQLRALVPADAAALLAIHADAGSFIALALLAAALSLAFAQTRSLYVPIAMHMLFNGVNLLLLWVLMRTG